MIKALKHYWTKAVAEGIELGLFLFMAVGIVLAVQHPESILYDYLGNAFFRRLFVGVGIGCSLALIIYSPLGKYSGAHFNPVISLAFYRVGRIGFLQFLFNAIGHFAGGVFGIFCAMWLFGDLIAHPTINYLETAPGEEGILVAFFAEFLIAFIFMFVVLHSTSLPTVASYTGIFAGCLFALFITLEAPFSGMGLNPARVFASFVFAGHWEHYWLYVTAPIGGMLLAAEIFYRWSRTAFKQTGL